MSLRDAFDSAWGAGSLVLVLAGLMLRLVMRWAKTAFEGIEVRR